jgi:EAL domain-containing protein (putative c-di-GMP-specific phosphodiesterase class I)
VTALLDQILAQGGLSVVFQPVVELAGPRRRLHGLECLTRGPEGTNAARASVMFDYVRRKHMEPAVDRACIVTALREAAALPGVPRLALNVHASTLGRDRTFAAFVADASAQTGVHPTRLTFEIVEHTHYWDGVTFAGTLHELRGWGAKIALDDVGLGHSNYRMMLEVRPDYLKVDRYIVHGAAGDPHRRAVLESIAQLAGKLESRVVGEGVEDPSDLATLRELGIDLVQGYLLATPLTAADLLESGWLHGQTRKRPARRQPQTAA